jgi:hypothetical protein
VDDVLRTVPGLFLQNRYGNYNVRISIRGFGSRSNSGIRGVRILLDSIPESEPDGQTRIEAIDFNSILKTTMYATLRRFRINLLARNFRFSMEWEIFLNI